MQLYHLMNLLIKLIRECPRVIKHEKCEEAIGLSPTVLLTLPLLVFNSHMYREFVQ